MRVAGRGVPWQTVANRATVAGFPGLFRGAVASDPGYPASIASANSWYDGLDITSTGQSTVSNRLGSGVATFTNGPTLTVGGPATLDGVDDFVQLPAGDAPTFTDTTGAYTILVVGRFNTQPASALRVMSTESANNNGLLMRTFTTPSLASVVNATSAAAASSGTIGGLWAAASQVNNGTLAHFDGTTLGATVSIVGLSFANIAPRLGTRAYSVFGSVAYQWHATVVWQSAPSQSTLADAAAYLIGLR